MTAFRTAAHAAAQALAEHPSRALPTARKVAAPRLHDARRPESLLRCNPWPFTSNSPTNSGRRTARAKPVAPLTERYPDLVLEDAYAIQTDQHRPARRPGPAGDRAQGRPDLPPDAEAAGRRRARLRRADRRDVRRGRRSHRARPAGATSGRGRTGVPDGARPGRAGRHHRPSPWPRSPARCPRSRSSTAGSPTGRSSWSTPSPTTPRPACSSSADGCSKLDDLDLRLLGVVVSRHGELIDTGACAAALGNPARCVAWLANKLGSFGDGLQGGRHRPAGGGAQDGAGAARRRVPRGLRAPRGRHRAVLGQRPRRRRDSHRSRSGSGSPAALIAAERDRREVPPFSETRADPGRRDRLPRAAGVRAVQAGRRRQRWSATSSG